MPFSSGSTSAMSPSTVSALSPFDTQQPSGQGSPVVHCFYDNSTATWTYIVADPETKKAVIIDSVLDYDPASGKIAMDSVKGLVAFVQEQGYEVERIMETHVHADHLTGAVALKELLPRSPPIFIGAKVEQVQKRFAPVYGYHTSDFEGNFDGYLHDEGSFTVGNLKSGSISLPGHTPDSMGIIVGDCLFAGDSIFLPDVGTARVDFPGGSAESLYNSVQRVLSLEQNVRVFSGHDYPVNRAQRCEASVSEQVRDNKHVHQGVTLEQFTKMRRERDAQLGTPRLLHASLQVNLRAGRMPPPDAERRRFIKLPLEGTLPSL